MKNTRYIVAALSMLTTVSIYTYDLYIDSITNDTPYDIVFSGKDVQFPMGVPTLPSRQERAITPQPFSPITIPGHKTKRIKRLVVNDEESKSGAEIFMKFSDKNGQIVFLVARGDELFKFAPQLNWDRDTLTLSADKSHYITVTFTGKDGIANATIKKTHPRRRR